MSLTDHESSRKAVFPVCREMHLVPDSVRVSSGLNSIGAPPMSLLKKLFGIGGAGAGKAAGKAAPERSTSHEGYEIIATPYEEQGKWQLCGVISKEVDGVKREHRFVRADRFASLEDAVEMTFFKGRQIIDQTGPRLFASAID